MVHHVALDPFSDYSTMDSSYLLVKHQQNTYWSFPIDSSNQPLLAQHFAS